MNVTAAAVLDVGDAKAYACEGKRAFVSNDEGPTAKESILTNFHGQVLDSTERPR